MGQPPLPLGAYGKVLFRGLPSGLIPARVKFRDFDGRVRHSHVHEETLQVVSGWCLVQVRGREIMELGPGAVIHVAPAQEHWHGASPHDQMTHLSLWEGGGTSPETVWGDPVTAAEYNAPRTSLGWIEDE